MKGDEKVIEYLNRAIRAELTAVNQYWLHYRLQEDWGLGRMAEKSRKESIEEMHHADRFIARVIFLDGMPNLQRLDSLRIGENARECLEADLAAEREAVALYREAYSYCDSVGDYISKKIFQDTLADEEGHVDFLETQLDLLDRIGQERFELLNAEPMDQAKADAGVIDLK
jgi:bacterioferritin